MPLSFRSENYGNIAFGFFNIESDMLLLENYFFFADDFCQMISELASGTTKNDSIQTHLQFKIYSIVQSHDIGDLMGAIHGIQFTGFIGDTYKLFPFPEDPLKFKQNPDGYKTQDVIKDLIEKVADKKEILIKFSQKRDFHIGSYVFDFEVFQDLIQYVEKGGYPEWKNEVRPEYVVDMKDCILKSNNSIFKQLNLF